MTVVSSKPSRGIAFFNLLLAFALFGGQWMATSPVRAEPDWAGLSFTKFSDMQAVNSGGSSTWTIPMSGTDQAYKLRGVVLNNPGDMLDATANYIAYSTSPSTLGQMGGQWQVFIQTLDPSDFGGSALWMAQNYGNAYPRRNTIYSYSDTEWNAEVSRVSLNNTLQAGDIIEVRARGGMFYGGKFNVNEQHDNDSTRNFDVIRTGHMDLPTPTKIALSDVKYADDTFKFFEDRTLTGAEHFQSTLVCLDKVTLTSGSSSWTNNSSTVTVTDGVRTLGLKLGLNGFRPETAPTGAFSVAGIFNQENSNTAGYQLWVTDPTQVSAVPEPGSIALLVGMALCLGATWMRRRR